MGEVPALMDLDEFVQSTIVQIMRGVRAAADAAGEIDEAAAVNPRYANPHADDTKVEFDVAITASGQNDAGGAAKVKVWGVASMEGGGRHVERHETISRVRFAVSVALPSRLFPGSARPRVR